MNKFTHKFPRRFRVLFMSYVSYILLMAVPGILFASDVKHAEELIKSIY